MAVLRAATSGMHHHQQVHLQYLAGLVDLQELGWGKMGWGSVKLLDTVCI